MPLAGTGLCGGGEISMRRFPARLSTFLLLLDDLEVVRCTCGRSADVEVLLDCLVRSAERETVRFLGRRLRRWLGSASEDVEPDPESLVEE